MTTSTVAKMLILQEMLNFDSLFELFSTASKHRRFCRHFSRYRFRLCLFRIQLHRDSFLSVFYLDHKILEIFKWNFLTLKIHFYFIRRNLESNNSIRASLQTLSSLSTQPRPTRPPSLEIQPHRPRSSFPNTCSVRLFRLRYDVVWRDPRRPPWDQARSRSKPHIRYRSATDSKYNI